MFNSFITGCVDDPNTEHDECAPDPTTEIPEGTDIPPYDGYDDSEIGALAETFHVDIRR